MTLIALAILSAGLSHFNGLTNDNPSVVQIFYWYVLPALPFVILSAVAFFPNVVQTYMVIGATFGAILAIAIPHLLLRLSLIFSEGGGANIGIGILFLAMPVYLPAFMIGGAATSRIFHLMYSGRKR